jgi:hypothetical protein
MKFAAMSLAAAFADVLFAKSGYANEPPIGNGFAVAYHRFKKSEFSAVKFRSNFIG